MAALPFPHSENALKITLQRQRTDSQTRAFRVFQSLGPTGTPKAHGALTLNKYVRNGESFRNPVENTTCWPRQGFPIMTRRRNVERIGYVPQAI